jgi:hypothetical protein
LTTTITTSITCWKYLKLGVASILISAVIWASKDPDARILLPEHLKTRIDKYEELHGNFVCSRQSLHIYTNREVVKVVDDIGNAKADGDLNDKMHLMLYEQKSMKRQLERKSQLNKTFIRVESRIDNLSESIDRVAVFKSGNSNINGPANLHNCKTLSQLWAEYQLDLGGNKPARLFTMSERNAPGMKFRYHWRKKFWNAMVALTRHTAAEVAVERLAGIYGITLKGGISGFCMRVGKVKSIF